jgi:hypothetical protein
MSTWVVQVTVVALFAAWSGILAVAWLRGRLGTVATALLAIAGVTWALALGAIASRYRGADGFATCGDDCTTVHYVSAVAFLSPPLLIALSAFGILVAVGRRARIRRAHARGALR